jgi:GntR family transcriptional regulator / MocR family aminotransferase
VRALARHVPGARVRGVAAGLHAVAELPGGVDEGAAVAAAARRGVAVYGMRGYRALAADAPAALVLGYAALSEPAIAAGIAELGRALADLA